MRKGPHDRSFFFPITINMEGKFEVRVLDEEKVRFLAMIGRDNLEFSARSRRSAPAFNAEFFKSLLTCLFRAYYIYLILYIYYILLSRLFVKLVIYLRTFINKH